MSKQTVKAPRVPVRSVRAIDRPQWRVVLIEAGERRYSIEVSEHGGVADTADSIITLSVIDDKYQAYTPLDLDDLMRWLEEQGIDMPAGSSVADHIRAEAEVVEAARQLRIKEDRRARYGRPENV